MTDAPLPQHPRLARTLVVLGAVLLLVSELGLFLDVEPFPTWFYVFAWWSYVALADGIVHLRSGRSLLLSRPRAFLLLVPWSVAFWLFFEAANLVLENWYYVRVPTDRLTRLAGITVSFATVLPAVLETADLLASFGILTTRRGPAFEPSARLLRAATFAGFAFLVLPLVFPEQAYPLVWGATVLLLEPLLYRRGARCYLSLMAQGEYAAPLRYLLAGLVCGGLWEFWNYWSAAKWIYTVPFFDELRLFEMPLLGFLGFPPFALECYTFARFLVLARLVPEFERDLPDPRRRGDFEIRLLGVSAAFFFSSLVLPGVESRTVRSTAPRVRDLIQDEHRLAVLDALGVHDLDELVAELRAGALDDPLGMTEYERLRVLEEARLLTLAGMGPRGVAWLGSVGVYDATTLAHADPDELFESLEHRGRGPNPRPYRREVRVWHNRAEDAQSDARPPSEDDAVDN